MITSTVKHLPKATAELEMQIPWSEIKDIYEKIFARVASEMESTGFRKGKAPKELVEKNINRSKIYEEVIKEIIPKAYTHALQEHKLNPVTSPKIELSKAAEGTDWVVKTTIALKPKILLKDYKEKIKELKKGKTKIWTPGTDNKKAEDTKKPTLDEVVEVLAANIEVELSDLLVEQETNRLLSNLLDQVQKLGLTVDQYLATKHLTSEGLRQQYSQLARKNLTVEFAIAEIAEAENITVAQEEIDKLIAKAEKEEDKQKLRQDSYYLAHLLRQQKTLDFLYNL